MVKCASGTVDSRKNTAWAKRKKCTEVFSEKIVV